LRANEAQHPDWARADLEDLVALGLQSRVLAGYLGGCGLGPAARGRHHLRAPGLYQHDRHAVEGNETAQLADEGAEGLVEVER
jgi:hypothetical protein